jgi:hypothetical protein
MDKSPRAPSLADHKGDRWLASKEAAEYLGLKPSSLSALRSNGKGPPYSASLSRDPRYQLSVLQAFMEARLVTNAAQARAARAAKPKA